MSNFVVVGVSKRALRSVATGAARRALTKRRQESGDFKGVSEPEFEAMVAELQNKFFAAERKPKPLSAPLSSLSMCHDYIEACKLSTSDEYRDFDIYVRSVGDGGKEILVPYRPKPTDGVNFTYDKKYA